MCFFVPVLDSRFLGCFRDQGNRALGLWHTKGLATTTTRSCMLECATAGYKYAGLQVMLFLTMNTFLTSN